MFEENENGVELANVDDADVTITESCFRLNAILDPNAGGSSPAASTAGIVCRGVQNLVRLKVRSTDFDLNQIGVLLRDGTLQNAGALDFGTSFTTPDLGRNTFTTDTQAPWYQFEDYSVSYCGFFNGMQGEARCVGNTWTFVSPSSDPNNQGANSSGQFPSGTSLTIVPGTNLESPSVNFPPHRPLHGTTDPQVPWNYSTATEIQSTGFPSILLVP